MPTSRVGSRGFTLLELLVTLGIIALVTALAAPAILGRLLEPPPSAKFARMVKGLLEQARASAATGGEPVAAVWLPEARRFTLALARDGASTVVQDPVGTARRLRTRVIEIPPEVEVSISGFVPVADAPTEAEKAEGLLFFPLGGSTGGSILIRAQGQAARLRVDRLTGAVQQEAGS